MYAMFLGATWSVSGIAYVVSIYLNRKDAQLAGVTITLLLCALSGMSPTLKELRADMGDAAPDISFGRWMLEALYVYEVRLWPEVYGDQVLMFLNQFGFDNGESGRSKEDILRRAAVAMAVQGAVFRVLAWGSLVLWNRGHQNRDTVGAWARELVYHGRYPFAWPPCLAERSAELHRREAAATQRRHSGQFWLEGPSPTTTRHSNPMRREVELAPHSGAGLAPARALSVRESRSLSPR